MLSLCIAIRESFKTRATTNKIIIIMESNKLYTALQFAGFILNPTFDGDIEQPNHVIYNEMGVYIGDILEAKGFTKAEENRNNKTWTTFRFDGVKVISHRSLTEQKVKTWSFSAEIANSID